MAAVAAVLRRYFIPLVLFSLGLFFQLVILPNAFPRSHYEVLGVRPHSTIDEVTDAYKELSAKWSSGINIPSTADYIKIRYAFELLTNPLWKRDYDLFAIDEQVDVIEEMTQHYARMPFSKVNLPLLNATQTVEHPFNVLSPEEFASLIGKGNTVLIQVYSSGSNQCIKFMNSWKRIATMLDGVADMGMVEVGEVKVTSLLAEKKATNQPFFRNGLPALIAFPTTCRNSDCLLRYHGDLSADAVVDWVATNVLGLPRIPYYSKESLVPEFIANTGAHKVKVIGFSKTGERAFPYLRQAARDYWAYASFAFILWREGDASIWWNTFKVESAPAIAFLKDPGGEPAVYHGSLNSSYFGKIMEQNKYFEIPQLRSVTSMELGCDARGYSRAGSDMTTWYCLILAGRPGVELSRMREILRRVQNLLAHTANPEFAKNFTVSVPAVEALKQKRLTFTWLDGEVQKNYCLFYLHSDSDSIYETCGPRRYDLSDVPRLFIVRYKRSSKESVSNVEKKAQKRNFLDILPRKVPEEDVNKALQLLARYNGSEDLQEIMQWISYIIEDGDTTNPPHFMFSEPELTPEDGAQIWSKGSQNLFSAGKGMIQSVKSIMMTILDNMADPRIGTSLLLGACLSFGTIWFQSSQRAHPTGKVGSTDNKTEKRRTGSAKGSNQDIPPSITDAEPQDAYQMLPSESDSD